MKNIASPVTVEEFSRLPDNGMRRELVRGEVREMPPPRSRHGFLTNRIQVLLSNFARGRKLGHVLAEMGFLIEHDPDTVRAPDCAFVRADRIPSPFPDEYFPFAPDLAVETLSPGDRPKEVREKVEGWIRSGARVVWVLDPERRKVTIHKPGSTPRILGEGDILEGEDLLQGFRIPVSELFLMP